MKTFLIFKKLSDGTYGENLGQYEAEEKDDTSNKRPYLLIEPSSSHFELLEGMDADVVSPVYVEEGYEMDAHYELQVNPLLLAEKIAASKSVEITALYNEMTTDVITQMSYIFGTTNTDSAAATERTWALMQEKPEKFIGAGLKAQFEAGGLGIGDALDTNAKVVAYAQAKTDQVEDYGVWRLQRIAQFTLDKEAVLNG